MSPDEKDGSEGSADEVSSDEEHEPFAGVLEEDGAGVDKSISKVEARIARNAKQFLYD